MTTDTREKGIYKTTLIGTAVNAVLIGLKFAAGVLGRSSAMMADAVHSLSDFVTDIIVLVFVKISGKPQDTGHDYGHGKYETFATMIIGLILAAAGAGLFVDGASKVVGSLRGESLSRPSMLALATAAVSIVSKEVLYRYTVRKGEKYASRALTANAWHHRSDAISSVGTLAGVAGAMFLGERWRILDPIAAIVVSLFIVKAGYDIMRPSIDELLESSLPETCEKEIGRIILSVPGVRNIHNLRTRRIGNGIAIDVHVRMGGAINLAEAHSIATEAERQLKEKYGPGT
ncbi:MAG: cation diffusion facilitator family transporter [Alistipes sp.]|nr:cation diffusion facilitator family transporter [Alistipes sp.]